MFNSLYSRLLIPGSFLLPDIGALEIDTVIIFVNQANHRPIHAIIKEVAQASFNIQLAYVTKRKSIQQRLNIDQTKLDHILIGFRVPLVVISCCFQQEIPLFDTAIRPKTSEEYIKNVVRSFQPQIKNCKNENIASTTTRLFTYCERHPYLPNNEYYKLGVIASLTTFREFLTQIELRRSA